jgi:hypothetical protein
MHIDIDQIDRMQMPELDDLRHRLRVSKRQLCIAVSLCPSTYQRWMRHFQGMPGGSAPTPRSVRAVREALKQFAAVQASSADLPELQRLSA